MIRIGEQHLRATLEQILATLRPHRGVRADGHERGREYFVVTRTEPTGARPRARRRGFEGKIQPLHGGGGYSLAVQKGRSAPGDPKGEAQFFASPASLGEMVRGTRISRAASASR